jgi:lysophospholipase L1-like esterase
VYGVGSSFEINALSVTSNQPASAEICAVGDSKTAGYFAGTLGASFANILGVTSTLSVLAGGAEMTADVFARLPEIISLAPTCVLLCIGRNDVANGLPPTEYETTYRAIVSALNAASIRVVHITPLYENSGISYTTLTNFIETTYPGQYIDTALYQFSAAYILNADNIHPSPAGHAQAAAVIQASGLLPIPMIYQDYLASQQAP